MTTPKQAEALLRDLKKSLETPQMDPLDYPSSWTRRQGEAYEAGYRTRYSCRSIISQQGPRVASLTTKIAQAKVSLNHAKEMLEQIDGEEQSMAPADLRRHNNRMSKRVLEVGTEAMADSGYVLQTLRLGALMRERGIVWSGSIPALEEQVAVWTKDLAEAQMMLDDACASATALPSLATV